MRRALCVSAALLAVVELHDASADTTVVLRASQVAPPGEPSRVGAQGVEYLDETSGQASVLRWDQVARVHGDLSQAAGEHAALAEVLWRARIRIERGDLAGAESLLDSGVASRTPRPDVRASRQRIAAVSACATRPGGQRAGLGGLARERTARV
jgi:hypothetical protein